MEFSNRLRQLRTERKVSQLKLGQVAGVTDRAIRWFETGEHIPNLVVVIKLADYFDVSLDYLVGRSDEPGGGRNV